MTTYTSLADQLTFFGLIFDVSCVHYVSARLQKISTMSFHCFCKSFLFVQIFNILFILFLFVSTHYCFIIQTTHTGNIVVHTLNGFTLNLITHMNEKWKVNICTKRGNREKMHHEHSAEVVRSGSAGGIGFPFLIPH